LPIASHWPISKAVKEREFIDRSESGLQANEHIGDWRLPIASHWPISKAVKEREFIEQQHHSKQQN
jgi:hypothetical protein